MMPHPGRLFKAHGSITSVRYENGVARVDRREPLEIAKAGAARPAGHRLTARARAEIFPNEGEAQRSLRKECITAVRTATFLTL
jgi:hypothetical protein